MTAAPRLESRKRDSRAAKNPHAEAIPPEELSSLVEEFYGTRTLVFDRAFAEAVLTYNTANRRINRRKLDVLAQQMVSGQFENTGEPIIISAEGVLNNGQHRLLTVIEADAVVDMDVRFGIPRRVFTKTDTGRPAPAATYSPSQAPRMAVLFPPLCACSPSTAATCLTAFVNSSATTRSPAHTKPGRISPTSRSACRRTISQRASAAPHYCRPPIWRPARPERPNWTAGCTPWRPGSTQARGNPAWQLRERLVRGIEAPLAAAKGYWSGLR